MQNSMAKLEDSFAISNKIKHALTIQSVNCALWYIYNELKSYNYTKTCRDVYRSLFNIAKTWKKPRCPSGSE